MTDDRSSLQSPTHTQAPALNPEGWGLSFALAEGQAPHRPDNGIRGLLAGYGATTTKISQPSTIALHAIAAA